MKSLNIDDVLSKCRELRRANKDAEAIKLLDGAIQQVADARLFYSRGITFDLMDEREKAIEDFTSAIRLDPTNPNYYFNRACILSYPLERDDEAISDFERVLELDPDHIESHRQCCLCLLIMGRPNRALEHAEAALKLAHDEADTHFCLGQSYMSLERFDEAVASFKRAVALDPTANHSAALAWALERQKNP